MTTVAALQAEVDERYAARGLPGWPDPHPGGTEPRPEEYSHLTAPERYRILHERARAWADVLASLPGVRAEVLGAGRVGAPTPRALDRYDRGVLLRCDRPGTLPLLLLERDAPVIDPDPALGPDPTIAVLGMAVADPDTVIEALPDCGCDACDPGSQHLLDTVDDAVAHVVGGPMAVLTGPSWQAECYPDGCSSHGSGRALSRLRDLCPRLLAGQHVRLPRRTRALLGRPWLPGAGQAGRR